MGDHPGVTFGFHLCRGNQASRWLVAGGYDWLAERLFPRHQGSTASCSSTTTRAPAASSRWRTSPDDAICVLGLVTTKTPRRETVPELAGRIREAAGVVPLERLALSPQCGFATSVVGNSLSLDDERAKLATIAETAAEVWG